MEESVSEINQKLQSIGISLASHEEHTSQEPKQSSRKRRQDVRTQLDLIQSHRGLNKIYSLLQETNSAFEEVISIVTCYRAKLGKTLEKVSSTYNRIINQTIANTALMIAKKNDDLKHLNEEHMRDIEKELLEREEVRNNLSQKQNNILALKTQLRVAKLYEKSLHNEIFELKTLLKLESFNENLSQHAQEFNKKLEAGPRFLKYVQKVCEECKFDSHFDDLQLLLKEMEGEQGNKTQITHFMANIVGQLIEKKAGCDVEAQVNEEELYWNIDPYMLVNNPEDPNSYYSLTQAKEMTASITRPRPTDETKWALTPVLMKFLANCPNRLAIPHSFATCKEIITDVCKERVHYMAEMTGFMQPPMPLDEFLCVYFLKKHSLRRLAELKMLEFLSSVKLYMSKMPRARLFAVVCGISGDLIQNEDYIWADFHSQMYFAYCLRMLTNDPKAYFEGQDGVTWLRNDRMEFYTSVLMPWVRKSEFHKRKIEMSYLSKTITDAQGQFGVYFDVDLLLNYFMKGFISGRQEHINKTQKAYLKRAQIQHNIFSYEEFKALLSIPIKKKGLPFPGEFTMGRAYFFALSCGDNSFEMTGNAIAAACIKYGLTNPAPLVQISFEDIFPYSTMQRAFDKQDERFSILANKVRINNSKDLKSIPKPNEVNKNTDQEEKLVQELPSIEKLATLMAQHYAVLRELTQYAKQFREIVKNKGDAEEIFTAFEAFSIVLSNASEFFSFPLTF